MLTAAYLKNRAHILKYRQEHPDSVKKSNDVQRAKKLARAQELENASALAENREAIILEIRPRGRPPKKAD